MKKVPAVYMALQFDGDVDRIKAVILWLCRI
jgi:hypothetical protein